MSQNLSNRQISLILAGSVLLALGMGSGIKLLTASRGSDGSSTQVAAVDEATSLEDSELAADAPGQPFEAGPFVPASGQLRLADPALLQSTSTEVRLDTVVAGRPDPFAPVAFPTASSKPKAQTAAIATAPTGAQPPQNLPVVPIPATQALPPLPSVPPPLPALQPLPPVQPTAIAANPGSGIPQPTQSLVERIEISGVAQVGNQVSVIVREPGANASRYVRAGDAIAGGQIRVKRIDLSSTEPVVILEYNGRDYPRTVGDTSLASL